MTSTWATADILRYVADFLIPGDANPRLTAVCMAWRTALANHHCAYRTQQNAPHMAAMMEHLRKHAARVRHLSLIITIDNGVEGLAVLTTLAWNIDWKGAALASLSICFDPIHPPPIHYRSTPIHWHLALRAAVRSVVACTRLDRLRVGWSTNGTALSLPPLADMLWPNEPLRRLHLDGLDVRSCDFARIITLGCTTGLETLDVNIRCLGECRHPTREAVAQHGDRCHCHPLQRLAHELTQAPPGGVPRSAVVRLPNAQVPGFVLHALWNAWVGLPGLAALEMYLDGCHMGWYALVCGTTRHHEVPAGASLRRLSLGLRNTGLTTAGFAGACLPLLSSLPHLRHLTIDASHNDIRDPALPQGVGDDARWRVARPRTLTTVMLDLRYNCFSTEGCARLAAFLDAPGNGRFTVATGGMCIRPDVATPTESEDPENAMLWQS